MFSFLQLKYGFSGLYLALLKSFHLPIELAFKKKSVYDMKVH